MHRLGKGKVLNILVLFKLIFLLESVANLKKICCLSTFQISNNTLQEIIRART